MDAWRRISVTVALCAAMLGGGLAGARAAEPLRIYAAGSLTAAMKALIEASGMQASSFADPVFGPAGLLRQRLAKGEMADLFASADMAQPIALADGKVDVAVVPFARNRMCLAAMPGLGLNPATMLDTMLDPAVRLATSTPVADPGGDYALAVFKRADAVVPGAEAKLTAKAMHLLGGPNTMVPVAGKSPAASIFLTNAADALLYYCSGAAALQREVPGIISLPVPEPLEVDPVYGMLVLTGDANANRFAVFILSVKGQEILGRFGLIPIASVPRPAQ